ncbi:MAG: hypothetical protein HQM15_00045 [Deltaproteobacteria bacterium]|nr:hypothetical protein [Deltaproteobacteria bacterium]
MQIQFPKGPNFYEVFFLKFHLLEEEKAIWLRFTLHQSTQFPAHADLWTMVADAGDPLLNLGHRISLPLSQASLSSKKDSAFYFKIGSALLEEEASEGEVTEPHLQLKWKIQFHSLLGPKPLYPYGWMYSGPIPKTKYLIEKPFLQVSGEIELNGKKYEFQNAPGELAHIWGKQHALGWSWFHGNTFKGDETAVAEGLIAQAAVGPFKAPPLAVFYLHIDGKDYFMNSARLWLKSNTRRSLEGWVFDVNDGKDRFTGSIYNPPQQCLGVRYTDPDTSHRYCHHNPWASMDLEHLVLKNGKWQTAHKLESRALSYEWVDLEPDSRVKMQVLG